MSYGCAKCRITLSLGAFRDKEYDKSSFSDEWYGCEYCGTMFCINCGKDMDKCPECKNNLHLNRKFKPQGEFRLPPFLRDGKTYEERRSLLEDFKKYRHHLDIEYFRMVIEEEKEKEL